MDTDRIKAMAQNPDFIAGIYNYCDRWCEWCAFTSRCMNYAMGQELSSNQQESNEMSGSFWESISDIFEMTMSLLSDLAQERGIDLDAAMEAEDGGDEQVMEQAKGHICTLLAEKYRALATRWLEDPQVWAQDVQVNISGAIATGEAPGMQEAKEVISWYLYFIQAKIIRALNGMLEGEDCGFDGLDRDANGSAKVALIGIDRSLAAWTVVHGTLQHDREGLQDILLCLERLRRKVETVFPGARAFVRPGFDEFEAPSKGRAVD